LSYSHFDLAAPEDLLKWAIQEFGNQFAVTTSFQAEGMVVVDMAAKISRDIRIITLDTGRLAEETYQMIETVRSHYGLHVETVSPASDEIEAMVTRFGPNLFYESVPYRSLCCHLRKVRPLERKLQEFRAWAVGLRRSQSETRESLVKAEEVDGRVKLSPLADWTAEQVSEYIRANGVPLHPLYAKGYTSIGCGPCTRATGPGEDARAGRWWWEQDANKECGIHFSPDGKIERTLDVLVRDILTGSHTQLQNA